MITIEKERLDRLLRHKGEALKVYCWVLLHDGKSIGLRRLAEELGVTFQQVRLGVRWCVQNTLINTAVNTGGNTAFRLVSTCKPTVLDCRNKTGNTPMNTPMNTPTNTLKEKETEKEKSLPQTPTLKEKDKEKENTPHKGACAREKRKPTLEEVKAYFDEKKITDIDAEYFWSFYEANGWVQGRQGKPIKDWKRCVTTWRKMPQYNNTGTSRADMRVGVVIHDTPDRFNNDIEGW